MITVAITMRVTNATGYDEPRDSISHDWLTTLSAWGMTPLLLPNLGVDSVEYLKAQHPDILLLTGGEDPGTSVDRDNSEAAILDYALSVELPVFGVCRGLQFINKHLGGQLGTVSGHVNSPHKIKLSREWASHYGDEVIVNSYHNTTIPKDGLADQLVIRAEDIDGNIEAAQHREKPLAAVMWHPERVAAPNGDQFVFKSLISKLDTTI